MLKRSFLIIFLLFASGLTFSQTKYMIYFKDKGIKPGEQLQKSALLYKMAESMLDKKSIERRKKSMGDDIVTYEDLPVREEYAGILENMGIKIQNRLKWFNAVSAYLNDEQVKNISALGFIEKLEKVRVIRTGRNEERNIPSAPLQKTGNTTALDYGYSYTQLSLSDVPQVHKKGITGQGVIIGLLDTGFDWKEHESLQGAQVLKEYDFVFKDTITANQPQDAADQDSHGTDVFSMVGAYKPGKMIGGAFGAKFILAKTEDVRSETHVEEDNYAAALEWMESMGVDITSSSLGYNEFDAGQTSYTYSDMNGKTAITTKAAELAFQRGVLVLTAAGNEGDTPWHYITAPADGFNTIAVGAVTSGNRVAAFSSRGPSSDGRIKPDIVAQGVGVYGARAHTTNVYSSGNGTSFATPLSCGVAGLLMSAFPYLTNVQMRGILQQSSDNALSPDNDRGYGLVSAYRAIEYPNIEQKQNSYILHKAILDSNGVKPESVRMFYSTTDSDYIPITLNALNINFYTADITSLGSGNVINFYFNYQDSTGQTIRNPKISNYRLKLGGLIVFVDSTSKEPETVPEGYVLSQNYPNPFNNSTRIDFRAQGRGNAELFIINAIGQKVMTINLVTKEGINSVVWNGTQDNGRQCASGVYYYILRLSGKDYGNKMILLK